MTDVRLTALNPVDSQVYPVACNTSGELLVAQDDPGPDLLVEGDLTVNGSSALEGVTIGTDKITFDASTGSGTFAGTISDSIGPLRKLGVNDQTGNYTFTTADSGKLIRSAGSSALLFVNQSVFSAGDMISIFNSSSSDLQIVQGSGVTLYNAADGTTGDRTLASYGLATVVCTANNEFAISGSQLT